MNRRPRILIGKPAKQALDDISREPLSGLGLEDEMADSDLTEKRAALS